MFRRKLLSFMLALALLLPFETLPVLAAERPEDTLKIETTGETLQGTSVYRSPVTLTLSAEPGVREVLIKEDGLWMSLSLGEDGTCTLNFQNDGVYRFRFCTEDADGLRSKPQDVSFIIDVQLAGVLDACRALPSLDASNDQMVEARRAEIMSVQGQFSDLTDVQRAYFPADEEEHLSVLVRWLNSMRPGIDVFPPETPLIAVSEKKIGDSNIYPEGTQIKVYTEIMHDVDHMAIRREDGVWQPIEKQWDSYIETFKEPGVYTFDICSQDAYGNHSPAREFTMIISTELYEFMQKAEVAVELDAEQSLLDYYALDMRKRSMVGQTIWRRLSTLYEINCNVTGVTWKAEVDGQPVDAIGMLRGFPLGNAVFSIDGAESARTLPNITKKIFYEYSVTFQDAKNGEKKDPAQPVLIRLGIPPFLRSHKGVAVYDSTGNAVESRIRSEDSGLVLEFLAARSGVYYFAADS